VARQNARYLTPGAFGRRDKPPDRLQRLMENPMKRKSTNNLNHGSDRVNPAASGRELSILARRESDHEIERAAAAYRRDLGHSPKGALSAAITDDNAFEDTDFNDDDDLRDSEYRSDWRRDTGQHNSGGLVRLHPVAVKELTAAVAAAHQLSRDTVRELATAISGALQFHPHTVRELAKAVVLQLELLPETITKLAEAMYERFQKDMAALVELNAKQADGKVACSVCAEDDHRHVHQFDDMTTKDVCAYMGWKPSAIYGRTKNGRMPPPVSAIVPHMYDPHCIALLKEHNLVFPQARYDRAVHLALLPKVEAERARRKAAFHKKQSSNMTRVNKERAAKRANEEKTATAPATKTSGPKSTHTRTPKTTKR
jgi:hypothetical protein